jgi:hypothetical protein
MEAGSVRVKYTSNAGRHPKQYCSNRIVYASHLGESTYSSEERIESPKH